MLQTYIYINIFTRTRTYLYIYIYIYQIILCNMYAFFGGDIELLIPTHAKFSQSSCGSLTAILIGVD